MKKVFLLLLVTCSLSLTSCSKDDDGPSTEEIAAATDTNGKSILGVWAKTESGVVEGETITRWQEFTFNADKTGTYKATETGQEDENVSFTWLRNGDDYTLTASDEADVFSIGEYDGDMALLNDGGEVVGLKQ